MNFRVQESSLFGGKFISFSYAVGFLHYLLWLILFKTNKYYNLFVADKYCYTCVVYNIRMEKGK